MVSSLRRQVALLRRFPGFEAPARGGAGEDRAAACRRRSSRRRDAGPGTHRRHGSATLLDQCHRTASRRCAWIGGQRGQVGAEPMSAWNAFGYLAAGLVVAAFCMEDIRHLRVVGVASNVAFLAYGL